MKNLFECQSVSSQYFLSVENECLSPPIFASPSLSASFHCAPLPPHQAATPVRAACKCGRAGGNGRRQGSRGGRGRGRRGWKCQCRCRQSAHGSARRQDVVVYIERWCGVHTYACNLFLYDRIAQMADMVKTTSAIFTKKLEAAKNKITKDTIRG